MCCGDGKVRKGIICSMCGHMPSICVDEGLQPEECEDEGLLAAPARAVAPATSTAPSVHISSSAAPSPCMSSDLIKLVASSWLTVRWALVLPTLIALPVWLYRHDIAGLERMWWVPIMGTVAAAIPSGGAPVAGGIVFIPVLTRFGVCPSDAVAFTAATQMFGVGIFTPLNWLARDPAILDLKALRALAPPSFLGLLLSLGVLRVAGSASVLIGFSIFCLIVAAYVAAGLARGALNLQGVATPQAELFTSSTRTDTLITWVACTVGGLLTGCIGVSIEKVAFVLLTCHWGRDVRQASVTSVTLVGWLSAAATAVHALERCSESRPGFDLPVQLWLAGLPGILIGSIVGPKINQLLGPRRVMLVFCVLLAFEAMRSLARAINGQGDACVSQCLLAP